MATEVPLVLTLHQRDERKTYTEHPTEVARRALMDAADVETPRVAASLRRVAESLPDRKSIRKHGA